MKTAAAMARLVETTHDASNTLSAAMLRADLLREAGAATARGERADVDAGAVVEALREQLLRLRALFEEARAVGRGGARTSDEVLAWVEPRPVVLAVLRDLRLCFPRVALRAVGGEGGGHVRVCGGATGLARIIENLVRNACQGDGVRGAGRVEVCIEEALAVGCVAISVCDDGPGFSPALLARPVEDAFTTKPDGSGCGLPGTLRRVRASGGSLVRDNRPAGGARVRVFLSAC
ncbi:MAG: ATP-binding protein [Myxococcota bacterium]